MTDEIINSFDASIPATNYQIIELFNKIKSDALDPSPLFQRKLVWKKPHKIKFIETILNNFPFPEIYIAPGKLDTEKLTRTEYIVDGQQRLTTIVNYIEGKDVFALGKLAIPTFSELSQEEKGTFLNYEVSVRYLKNATQEQIAEVFQRINNTEYALNKTERLNAQWGDSEFICFAKQIIEEELDVDTELIEYVINQENRKSFLNFFHQKYKIFTEYDNSRMLSLQYILTLLATICQREYFQRNNLVQKYIELYYDEFRDASEIESSLLNVLRFIDSLNFDKRSYWFNKANIFTLICELYKYDCNEIDKEKFKESLIKFEELYRKYTIDELAEELVEDAVIDEPDIFSEKEIRYFEYAREAVNEKAAREYRGSIIKEFIQSSFK